MPAATAQLAGQLSGRRPLHHAPQDQDEVARGPLGALQGGAGPGVEHPAARHAAVVQDRLSMGPVDGQALAPAARADEARGMEGLDQEVVAGGLIQEVNQGEVHGWSSARAEELRRGRSIPRWQTEKRPTTSLGS